MKLKKGDQVIVITGKDKGKTGTLQFIKQNKAIVQGINMCKQHLSKKKHGESKIITRESMIHISNIAYYDGTQASKIGYSIVKNKKQRIIKKTMIGVNNVSQ